MDKNEIYRNIPKVDALLAQEPVRELARRYGKTLVTEAIREETDALRERLRTSEDPESARAEADRLTERVEARLEAMLRPSLRRVINGTGTVLHTNLGRAPLSREQARKLAELASGYCNLEFDLDRGVRGGRGAHYEELLCRLTGAEAAMAVNNNAAAVLLALSALARGGEVLVSRGELVEIGGGFRVPEVCAQSGALLREVGATNKTHLYDYEAAIGENTRAILKVHPSNFRIVGFTESVEAETLAALAHGRGIPLVEDLGSGVLADLSAFGLAHEPTVGEAVAAGADVVCFSGDKLLGGPQAGIVVGKGELIQRMKSHPLARALRVDKFTAAALELTLREYLTPERAPENIPVLRMLRESEASLRERAERLRALLIKSCPAADFAVVPCDSQAGGGSLPLERLAGAAVSIRAKNLSPEALARRMLAFRVPVISRISRDSVLLDVRTIDSEDFPLLAEMLGEVLS